MKKKKKVPTIPRKYVKAVEQGVKFLDFLLGRKEWLSRMDMSKFDIENPEVCIAGNVFETALFESSDDGFNSFVRAVNTIGNGENAAERFGFQSPSTTGYQHLQDLWVMKIGRLKRAAHMA